jgi:hypothetical protein
MCAILWDNEVLGAIQYKSPQSNSDIKTTIKIGLSDTSFYSASSNQERLDFLQAKIQIYPFEPHPIARASISTIMTCQVRSHITIN